MTDDYHHGDLPNALRAAAADVIVDEGLGAFSLREVARRAGVSHAAPAHHFGNTTGLLTSLATEALVKLRSVMEEMAEGIDDPVERLVAIGRGYVETGLRHPGHAEVVFRSDLIHTDNPAYETAGLAAYSLLADTVRGVADAVNPDLDVDVAAKLCWSAMQGLLTLHPSMDRIDALSGREPPSIDDAIVAFTDLIINGLRARRA